MATTIIGVDFSGAKEERNTWMAHGIVDGSNQLHVDKPTRISREDLFKLIASDVAPPAVVAMDFPFGLPKEYVEYMGIDLTGAKMPLVWEAVRCMSRPEFMCLREFFIDGRNDLPSADREPKRVGDGKYHSESFSPLHNVQPNMLPMTYEGNRLLSRWYTHDPDRFYVPPLEKPAKPCTKITLLETMPGALLKSIKCLANDEKLVHRGYKSGPAAKGHREYIIENIGCQAVADATGIKLTNASSFREDCVKYHDCLDAVIAAVGAAAWARDSSRFHHPNRDELADAALEGWIYVPRLDGPDGSG